MPGRSLRSVSASVLFLLALVFLCISLSRFFITPIPKPAHTREQAERRLLQEAIRLSTGSKESGLDAQQRQRVLQRIAELDRIIAAQPVPPLAPLWRQLMSTSWFPLLMTVLAACCGTISHRLIKTSDEAGADPTS